MPDSTPLGPRRHTSDRDVGVDAFDEALSTRGWLVVEDFVDAALVHRMLADLDSAYGVCRRLQIASGISLATEGTLHHLIGLGESFLEFIDRLQPLVPHFERYFQGKFILNSFGGNILRASASYASAIHRDIRTYSGELPLLMNTLLMLDDFTLANGATRMMTGSHLGRQKRPDEAEFNAVAEVATGRAGSLLVFNSNLWHAAGVNTTELARRSVTPMFCRPFVKAQFDYPRVLGYERKDDFSELQQQVLGYYSRIPATLEEWYQPPQQRMYRPEQG